MREDRINTPATPEAARLVHVTEGSADIQIFALTTENYRPDLVHQAAFMDRYPLAGYSIDIILIDQSSVMFAMVHEATGAVTTENAADYDRQAGMLTLRTTIERPITAGEIALVAYLAQHVAIGLLLRKFPEPEAR